MKNWTVRRQIIVGFSAVIMIMVALALFAMFRLTIIRARTNTILTDTLPGLYGIAKIDSLSKEQYTLLQKHVLITDKDEERQIETQMTAVSRNLDELYREYEKSIFTEEDRRLFDATKDARKVYSDAVAKVLDFSRHADPKEAEAEMERQVDPPFQAFMQSVQNEVAFNQRQGEESGRNIHDAVNSAETGIILALGIGLVLACLSCYFLTQAINKPLARVVDAMQVVSRGDFSQRLILDGRGEFGVLAERLNLMTSDLTILVGSVKESGIRVNTSATEIAATSQQQLATSNEIAATTSEVGATSKEISATSKELTQTVKDLTEVAEKAASLAGSGHAGLLRMRTTMQQIMEASASINAKLAVLSEKAGNIGTVVTTITKVADQTNLLSLNAAIEAEKAGEHGRGFSVVSTEIRRLADQTALATTDIEQMVKEIQSAVSAGVMGMDKFSEEVRRGVDVMHQVSEELTQIIQQVQSLTASFETVNEGMQSQSIGAQQISEALGQLSEASRQTVESLQQSNQAIEQLNIAARTMQNGVARFTLPV